MAQLPGIFDLRMYRRDSYGWRFEVWDLDEEDEPTIPVDLTDAEVEAEIRDKRMGSVVVPLDVDVTLPNIIDVRIGATQWALMPKRGVWDLQITPPSLSVRTIVQGDVVIDPDVTESTP